MAWDRFLFVLAVTLLAGCSGSTASAPTPATTVPTSSVTPVSAAATETQASASIAPPPVADPSPTPAPAPTPEPTRSSAPVSPLEPAGEPNPANADDIDTSAWISRRSMSTSSIEVTWSAPEGAVSYQLHRLPRTSDTRPADAEMNSGNLIHSGDETGVFLDEGVTAAEKYWYGIRGINEEGAPLSVGWHKADAITDTEPPAPVDLSLDVVDGTIRLEWSEAKENYKLHGYRVHRAVNGDESEVIATTWNLAQRSFLDDEPPRGIVTYGVEAFDFHWNDSELTTQTVELP